MKPWYESDWVAFDLETTGKYPLESEICEIGAVKWRRGLIVGEFQCLVRPSRLIPNEVIAIHGISNEMVKHSPEIEVVLPLFVDFCRGAHLLAHNASFDMGFLACDLERLTMPPLGEEVLCTSLLSRKLIPESPNHRLQTLVNYLSLPRGTAHRALDDARACLGVGLECLKRGGSRTALDMAELQRMRYLWDDFFLSKLRAHPEQAKLLTAIKGRLQIEIVYSKGSHGRTPRPVIPIGIVRNPKGDFMVGICGLDQTQKRFFLSDISQIFIAGT